MEANRLNRINELARKAKIQPLSETELAEQQTLRQEYIGAYRKNLRVQLDNIVLVDEDGHESSLKKK